MAVKLLVCFYLLQVVLVNLVDAQFHKFHPEVEDLLRNLTSTAFELDNCDKTACHSPCPGAYPPLRCPPDIPPACHFGCACYTDCRRGMVTCFQTKHCLQTGRFFTARRRGKPPPPS